MKKLTALEILEEAFDEGAFDRAQVRDALEDGAYLTQCGYTDDDQEAIEELTETLETEAEEYVEKRLEIFKKENGSSPR